MYWEVNTGMNSAKQVTDLVAGWKAAAISSTQLVVNKADAEVGWPYAWGATGQYCTVANRKARMNNSRICEDDKELIRKRCQVLNGSKVVCAGCAYYPDDQLTRMYDCIGFINDLLDTAGISHYGAGCTTAWNHAANWIQKGTLANMPEMVCLVFQAYPDNPNKMQHIGLYITGGIVIHCSKTVKKQQLGAYPWTHFGQLKGLGGDAPVPTPSHKTIRRGSTGPDVVECQEDLITLVYDLSPYGADGKFGAKTEAAVKQFQTASGLKADGIVGPATWAALDAAVGPQPEPTQLYTVHIPHQNADQYDKLKVLYPDAWATEEGSDLQ